MGGRKMDYPFTGQRIRGADTMQNRLASSVCRESRLREAASVLI